MQEGPWLAALYTAGFLFYLAFLLWRKGHVHGAKQSLIRPLIIYYIAVRWLLVAACGLLVKLESLPRCSWLQVTAIVEVTRFVWVRAGSLLLSILWSE